MPQEKKRRGAFSARFSHIDKHKPETKTLDNDLEIGHIYIYT
jgi:hypothetical protein